MFKAGIKVPDGFVLTTDDYDYYLKVNNLDEKIEYILYSPDSSKNKSDEIKSLFSVNIFPAELKTRLISAMRKLNSDCVAVRSSSTFEDLPGMSFAGQYASFLNVGSTDLIEKIVLCRQSLWNERAIEYRAKHQIRSIFSQAVVIQEMINARYSGIAFTANPMTGIRSEILINTSYGLGEAIVSGRVNPDQYIVNSKR